VAHGQHRHDEKPHTALQRLGDTVIRDLRGVHPDFVRPRCHEKSLLQRMNLRIPWHTGNSRSCALTRSMNGLIAVTNKDMSVPCDGA